MRKTDRFVKGKKALFLAAACTALLLSACGGEEKIADPSVQNTEAQKETEAETTEAELPASTEAETSPQTAPETLSPFQNFMESSIEQRENETTLSAAEKESIRAAEKESRRAEEAALAAEQSRQAAEAAASMAAEEALQASIDASIAESESLEQAMEESLAQEEMRRMNESADAEAAEIVAENAAGNGPGFNMTAPTAESPQAPGM